MTNKKCNALYGHVVVSHLALMMCKNMLLGNVQDKVKKIQLDELGVRMESFLTWKEEKISKINTKNKFSGFFFNSLLLKNALYDEH